MWFQEYTIVVGADEGSGFIFVTMNVVPPSLGHLILVIAHHLQTVFLLASIRLTALEVLIVPWFVIQPEPRVLLIFIRASQENCVVKLRVSCQQQS